MYDDDVRIRLAKPAEAEELTDIAWRSKGYWDYPSEVMSRFRGLLTIKQDFVEANPTYLIEHDDTGEKLGFYALEKKERRLVAAPHVGAAGGNRHGARRQALPPRLRDSRDDGAEELNILSDPNSEEFYIHMGAERAGETECKEIPGWTQPVLRIKL